MVFYGATQFVNPKVQSGYWFPLFVRPSAYGIRSLDTLKVFDSYHEIGAFS